MVWATLASALPSVLGSGGGGLGGLLSGGGKTKVTQNSSNTTSLNISALLSNQSPNAEGGNASGSANAAAQTSGQDLPASSLLVPSYGFNSVGAEDNFNAAENPTAPNKTVLYASLALVTGLGAVILFRKKR